MKHVDLKEIDLVELETRYDELTAQITQYDPFWMTDRDRDTLESLEEERREVDRLYHRAVGLLGE